MRRCLICPFLFAGLFLQTNPALTTPPKATTPSPSRPGLPPADGRDADRRADDDAPVVPVHCLQWSDEWAYAAETENFRVFHHTSRDLACQAARIAERTRAGMQRKWLGGPARDWDRRCEIYLYTTGEDYCRATGAPATTPGHSSFQVVGGQVVGRRIDLHCDDLNMLATVLPHETTHTVVAGRFGEQQIPRWADEGMAVLAEPRAIVDRHLRDLSHYRDRLFDLQLLMEMTSYPEPRAIPVFYAQSVSLVDFLVSEKGARVFSQFLREGMQSGYEPALRHYYGCRNFADLERRWSGHAFGEVTRN